MDYWAKFQKDNVSINNLASEYYWSARPQLLLFNSPTIVRWGAGTLILEGLLEGELGSSPGNYREIDSDISWVEDIFDMSELEVFLMDKDTYRLLTKWVKLYKDGEIIIY